MDFRENGRDYIITHKNSAMKYTKAINVLLKSEIPSVRWKVMANVLEEDADSAKMKSLQKEIKNSHLVKSLLINQNQKGEIVSSGDIYDKWQGGHWVLASLADLGYPSGEKEIKTAVKQLLVFWLNEFYKKEFIAKSKADARKKYGVPILNGRYRRCCSQQGNALYSALKLGFKEDDRVHELKKLLLKWQWPDGGWNCDKNPDADTSSFMESLIPMRSLILYSQTFKDKIAEEASKKAAEVFLIRKLFKEKSTGKIINREFPLLHYPLYWHYDILGCLKVLAEGNFICDKRCSEALDLLEGKQLEDGGFPAESKYYTKVSNQISLGADYINWGGTSKKKMNEWVTADALFVLKKAGRLN